MPLDTRIPLMAQPIQMPDFNAMAMQRQEMQRNAMAMQMQQAQLSQAQRAEQAQEAALQRRQQVGGMAAKGDFTGAGNAALEGGDFDMFQTIQSLDQNQRKQAAERNKTLAAVALSIQELPYEQRRQGIAAAMPYLEQAGIDPQMVETFDPTDENIMGIVGTTQTVQEVIDRLDKDRRFNLDKNKFSYQQVHDKDVLGVQVRGQDLSASTARRGQDISASSAAAGRAVTMRGQNMTNARAAQTQQGPQGTKTQQGVASQKIKSLRAIESQLGRVEAAMKTLEGGDPKNKMARGYTGALLGKIPGSFDAASNNFDKAVSQLSPLLRQLTRVPGEGAMSDYEAALAQMTLPSRTDTPEGRREALQGMRELIRNTRSGYEEFLGSAPSAAPSGGNVIRYDAKGNRIK